MSSNNRRTTRPRSATASPARRRLLAGAVAWSASAALPLLALRAAAATRASKKSVMYQGSPKNGEQCSQCTHFIAGDGGDTGECAVVAGKISPEGYCSVFQEG